MIVGIGTDVVGLQRFRRALERSPGLWQRLFTQQERVTEAGAGRHADSLAARFAAKEAVVKIMGGMRGWSFPDCEVRVGDAGRPILVGHGVLAELAASRGIATWHLSLSHDAGVAAAFVVAETADAHPAEPARGQRP